MSNNEIRTGAMSKGNYAIQYQKSGNGGCIPVIDGKPEPSLMFGYATETDKVACLRLIEEALRATNGDISKVQSYIMNAVSVAANEVTPDETIIVEGIEFLISYATKKAYFDNGMEITNLDDIECEMPDEAVKALLVARIETEIEKRRDYYDFDYDYEDEDDYE